MRELGRVAARYFDEVIVREDRHPRGREPGETAALVMEGIAEAEAAGARIGHAEIILDEAQAATAALDRARPGDLVVLCVDYATEIYAMLEARRGVAAPSALMAREEGPIEAVGGDPDLVGIDVTG
jgi:cyanophycin synthetase